MYEAMARRYRPRGFAEVIGQEHVARTLTNAITAERTAHAYLFCGPHGCGKTSMARIFARALVCEAGTATEPCGECELCRDIMSGRDVDVQEIDGASNNGVEQVRRLRDQAGYVPTRARLKLYIIDEVHMLSAGAFNALLKTLEEPPGHVKFILATTDPHKIPDTVLSRCQRFDFRLVPAPRLAEFFKKLVTAEKAEITDEAVDAVAAFSGGSVRDGLVLLDQLLSFSTGKVTREDVERVRGVASAEAVAGVYAAIHAHDVKVALRFVDEVAQTGTNVGDFLDQLIAFGRDLMLMAARQNEEGITVYGPARETLQRLHKEVSLDYALLILDVFSEARTRVRSRALTNPLVPLEMAVARLSGLDSLEPVGKLIQKLDALARGAPLPTAASVPVPAASVSAAIAPTPAVPAPVKPPQPTPVSAAATDSAPTTEATKLQTPNQPSPLPAEEEAIASVETTTSAALDTSNPSPEESAPPASPSPPPASTQAEAEKIAGKVAEADNEKKSPPPPRDCKEAWEDIKETLCVVRKSDVSYLGDVYPEEVRDDVLVLSVPGGGFILDHLVEPERRERIAAAAGKVLGKKLTVEYQERSNEDGVAATERYGVPPELDSEAKSAGQTSAQSRGLEEQQRREALRDPAVQQVIEEFEGRVMNIEKFEEK